MLTENLRRNVGQILAAAFQKLRHVNGLLVGPAAFVSVSFGACELRDVTFRRCSFLGTRLEAARFENCTLEDGRIERIRVSHNTRLNIEGLIPGGNVMSVADVEQGETFSPPEIADVLRRLGTPLPATQLPRPKYTQQGMAVVRTLQKLARAYQRTTTVCTGDDFLRKLFNDPSWPALERLLLEHKIVKSETRPTSGTSKTFFRPLVSMPDLMRHEMEMTLPVGHVGNFWTAVRGL